MRAVVVVMRVTTLKATSARLPGLLAYYAGLAEDRERPGVGRGPVDYYLDPDGPPGRWWGRGREALGLDGPVSGAGMRAVLEAQHPETGRRLGRRFGDASAGGIDTTFSAPKSVSVLWALTPDAYVRAEVLAAHDATVDAAFGWLESHGAATRHGRDGVFQLDTRGLMPIPPHSSGISIPSRPSSPISRSRSVGHTAAAQAAGALGAISFWAKTRHNSTRSRSDSFSVRSTPGSY